MNESKYQGRHVRNMTGRFEIKMPPEVRVRYAPRHRAPKHLAGDTKISARRDHEEAMELYGPYYGRHRA